MRLASFVALLLTSFLAVPALAGGAPSETVVLVNESSADSVRVAERYVAARQIPPTNVCRVSCTTELTVKRDDFVRDVVDPLRALLDANVLPHAAGAGRTLRDRVRFIVLTQGMPIRADGPGGAVSTAELLALLDTNVCGQDGARMPRVRNPYTRGPAPGPAPDGSQLFLVTALISSTADEAMALIDRSVAADGTAPEGAHWIYQDAAGAAGVRNGQYDAARAELERAGHTTEHVGRGNDVVVDRKRVMGYMSGGSYSALSPEGVARNEYLPGALSDMLQSFGAVPQNFGPDGKGGSQFPVTHMVRAGVTGVQGTVAEPYNVAFPPADLFTPYSQGFTLAETFHQKIPFRYWMNLVLGDPLCAPYATRVPIDVELPTALADEPVRIRAPGAVRVTAFVDGVSLGTVDGAEAAFRIPTDALAAGTRRLLVEATGPGDAEPRSWRTLDLAIEHAASRPCVLPPQLAIGAALDVPLTCAPRSHASTLTCDGAEVPHRTLLTPAGLQILVERAAAAALAGRALRAELTLDGTTYAWSTRMGPARIRVECAGTVTAGEALDVDVVAEDAAGAAVEGWAGTVELRGATPPVRWARAAFGDDGHAHLRFASPRAGSAPLEVLVPGTSLASALDVTVLPGPPSHATTPLARLPLGQAADVPIRLEDAFGNAVAAESGDLDVSFPDDPHAHGAGSVRLRGGSGVLRDVILTRPGRQRVVIREGSRVWSQPQEGVEAQPDCVRAWLATRAYRGKEADALFAGDPSDGLHADGGAPGGRLFRRLRDGDATVDLPAAGSRDGDAAAAVAFVQALDDTDVTLRLAAAGRVRVLVDGAEVFDGVPAESDPRKAPADAAELKLASGLHRLAVVVERKGRFGFRLALAAGDVPLAPTLRVPGGSGSAPGELCVSGRVLRPGERPAAGARVEVTAGDAQPRHAVSAPDGSWFVAGVPDGKVTVRLVAAPGLDDPVEQIVEMDGAHATDVDLRIVDRTPPAVSVAADGSRRAGRTLRLVAQIADDGGIDGAWLEAGGERLRGQVTRDPWTLSGDVAERPRGPLEVVVVAVDAAGNEGRSAPVRVELVDDADGPGVTLRGLARNATLRKVTKVTATARDPIGVATVAFFVDDVALGAPLATEPYEAELDPAALGPGRHELACVAHDADGNETRVTLPFRVK